MVTSPPDPREDPWYRVWWADNGALVNVVKWPLPTVVKLASATVVAVGRLSRLWKNTSTSSQGNKCPGVDSNPIWCPVPGWVACGWGRWTTLEERVPFVTGSPGGERLGLSESLAESGSGSRGGGEDSGSSLTITSVAVGGIGCVGEEVQRSSTWDMLLPQRPACLSYLARHAIRPPAWDQTGVSSLVSGGKHLEHTVTCQRHTWKYGVLPAAEKKQVSVSHEPGYKHTEEKISLINVNASQTELFKWIESRNMVPARSPGNDRKSVRVGGVMLALSAHLLLATWPPVNKDWLDFSFSVTRNSGWGTRYVAIWTSHRNRLDAQ